MPGDPNTCRRHSSRCLELADQATDPIMKQLFLELAARWTKIALEIEETDALVAAVEEPVPRNLGRAG